MKYTYTVGKCLNFLKYKVEYKIILIITNNTPSLTQKFGITARLQLELLQVQVKLNAQNFCCSV